MDDHLRAGIAVYNVGQYHAAHDAWEERWLDLQDGTEDERFLHGLIQFTAAVHHAFDTNTSGATGLAKSAGGYLADLPAAYRGVNVGEVRSWLGRFQRDPELIEREPPLELRYEGEVIDLTDLTFPAANIAAVVLAGALEYDEAMLERATRYVERDLADDDPTSPVVALVLDFVRGDHRGIAYQRLRDHVQRRDRREADVAGLFDEEE